MVCKCGSTRKVHDHKLKFTKYLGRHYWEAQRSSSFAAAVWLRRARKAGFPDLTSALRASRPFRTTVGRDDG